MAEWAYLWDHVEETSHRSSCFQTLHEGSDKLSSSQWAVDPPSIFTVVWQSLATGSLPYATFSRFWATDGHPLQWSFWRSSHHSPNLLNNSKTYIRDTASFPETISSILCVYVVVLILKQNPVHPLLQDTTLPSKENDMQDGYRLS